MTIVRPHHPPQSRRSLAIAASMADLADFQRTSSWARRRDEPGISDFTFGNPHEMPLAGLVSALQAWSVPLNKDWFAYKASEQEAREVAASGLRQRTGVPFEADDLAMTNAGIAALMIAIRAVTDPGDEVIYSQPAWFLYDALIVDADAIPVRVDIDPATFDIDPNAIAAAITERTRVVIVNSPHNPTGKVVPTTTLAKLAAVLEAASARNGRTIYLLSDEPYAKLVFDGKRAPSPAEHYAETLIAYSYGKVLLAPGQRIGYLAISPDSAAREELRSAIFVTQIATGWSFPSALMQHALPDLERLSIDLDHLRRKRDRLTGALSTIGYTVHIPEGTFYLFPQSPLADDRAFAELLAKHDVFVMPGSFFGTSGYFRVSLTASEEMIERSLPIFAAAWHEATASRLAAAD
ncbi:MAG: aminotransferase class I/II-fold pyridoxal phosphate-dependent enzyme [Candidatus Limnocylindria bacterium]